MIEKEYLATDDSLPEALAFIEEELEKVDCSAKDRIQITVSVEEMFVNVAHYAYNGEVGTVTLSIDNEEGVVTIRLIDEGIAFDPLAKEDPDITMTADERTIGGLGIFMVKKSMNEVAYERKNGKNIFVMKKKIR